LTAEQESQGALQRAWNSVTGLSRGRSEANVFSQYVSHAQVIEDHTDNLITEGEGLLMQINALDDMLDILRETANHDYAKLLNEKEDLISSLWAIFGVGSADRRRVKKNIDIAKSLRETREKAATIVRLTIDELRRIKNDLGDLQQRVVSPTLRGAMDRAELEEHLHYVQDGLDRLYKRRSENSGRKLEGSRKLIDAASGFFAGQGKLGFKGQRLEVGA